MPTTTTDLRAALGPSHELRARSATRPGAFAIASSSRATRSARRKVLDVLARLVRDVGRE